MKQLHNSLKFSQKVKSQSQYLLAGFIALTILRRLSLLPMVVKRSRLIKLNIPNVFPNIGSLAMPQRLTKNSLAEGDSYCFYPQIISKTRFFLLFLQALVKSPAFCNYLNHTNVVSQPVQQSSVVPPKIDPCCMRVFL